MTEGFLVKTTAVEGDVEMSQCEVELGLCDWSAAVADPLSK